MYNHARAYDTADLPLTTDASDSLDGRAKSSYERVAEPANGISQPLLRSLAHSFALYSQVRTS